LKSGITEKSEAGGGFLTRVAEELQKDERLEASSGATEQRAIWCLALIYLFLAAAITWPAALSPLQTVPGAARTDLWNSLWSIWFVHESVLSGVVPIDIPWLDWPNVGQLIVADPLNALLGLPLVTVFGLSGAYTFLILTHITFSGVATHLLARHIYGCDQSGWIAGVGFASAPVLISGVQNGTSESVAGGWLSLSLFALILALEHGGIRRVFIAAGALSLVCIGGWYTGVGAWIFLVAFTVVGITQVRGLVRLKRGLLVGLLALTVVGPIATVTMTSAETGSEIGIKNDRELLLVRRTTGSADPLGWVMPGDWRSPDFRAVSRDAEQFIHCHYLGWTLLVMAVVGIRRNKRFFWPLALSATIGGLLAMGPVIVRNGQPFIFGDGLAIPMPYFLLESLPGFGSLSLLFRLAIVPALALSLLAAGAGAGRSKRVVAGLVSALLVEAWFVAPTAGLPALQSSVIEQPILDLAGAPPGAVMNYPLAGGRPYLYEQTAHLKPIAGRLNFPNNSESMAVWQTMVSATESGEVGDEFLRTVRDRVVNVTRVECSASSSEPTECLGELIQRNDAGDCSCLTGVRYLVIHKDEHVRPDMHDSAVDNALSSFPILSQSDQVTVLSLW
jgi:hypothetical protein